MLMWELDTPSCAQKHHCGSGTVTSRLSLDCRANMHKTVQGQAIKGFQGKRSFFLPDHNLRHVQRRYLPRVGQGLLFRGFHVGFVSH